MNLLPSLRQKKRYLVFEIISAQNQKFSSEEIEKETSQALLSFLGQLGVAQASPLFLKEKFNYAQQRFLLKVNNKYVAQAKAALILIKKIKNNPLLIKSLTTSGTLKKASQALSG